MVLREGESRHPRYVPTEVEDPGGRAAGEVERLDGRDAHGGERPAANSIY